MWISIYNGLMLCDVLCWNLVRSMPSGRYRITNTESPATTQCTTHSLISIHLFYDAMLAMLIHFIPISV